MALAVERETDWRIAGHPHSVGQSALKDVRSAVIDPDWGCEDDCCSPTAHSGANSVSATPVAASNQMAPLARAPRQTRPQPNSNWLLTSWPFAFPYPLAYSALTPFSSISSVHAAGTPNGRCQASSVPRWTGAVAPQVLAANRTGLSQGSPILDSEVVCWG